MPVEPEVKMMYAGSRDVFVEGIGAGDWANMSPYEKHVSNSAGPGPSSIHPTAE